jgi:hypothetical protein
MLIANYDAQRRSPVVRAKRTGDQSAVHTIFREPRKGGIMNKKSFSFFLLLMAVIVWACPVRAEQEPDCFTNSLHHTGEGMRYWYEAKDGFMAITGTPYKSLGCKGCHVEGCNTCHLEETENGLVYSNEKARSSKTCLKCHARERPPSSTMKW